MAGLTYFAARGNVDLTLSDPGRQFRETARVVNFANSGRLNCSASLTLTANVASTTITDPRLSIQSGIYLMPTTQNAATELGNGTLFIVCTAGQAVVTHANAASTDRTYTIVLLG